MLKGLSHTREVSIVREKGGIIISSSGRIIITNTAIDCKKIMFKTTMFSSGSPLFKLPEDGYFKHYFLQR